MYNKLERSIPGFDVVMERVRADSEDRYTQRNARRAAQKRAEAEEAIRGHKVVSPPS